MAENGLHRTYINLSPDINPLAVFENERRRQSWDLPEGPSVPLPMSDDQTPENLVEYLKNGEGVYVPSGMGGEHSVCSTDGESDWRYRNAGYEMFLECGANAKLGTRNDVIRTRARLEGDVV